MTSKALSIITSVIKTNSALDQVNGGRNGVYHTSSPAPPPAPEPSIDLDTLELLLCISNLTLGELLARAYTAATTLERRAEEKRKTVQNERTEARVAFNNTVSAAQATLDATMSSTEPTLEEAIKDQEIANNIRAALSKVPILA